MLLGYYFCFRPWSTLRWTTHIMNHCPEERRGLYWRDTTVIIWMRLTRIHFRVPFASSVRKVQSWSFRNLEPSYFLEGPLFPSPRVLHSINNVVETVKLRSNRDLTGTDANELWWIYIRGKEHLSRLSRNLRAFPRELDCCTRKMVLPEKSLRRGSYTARWFGKSVRHNTIVCTTVLRSEWALKGWLIAWSSGPSQQHKIEVKETKPTKGSTW